MYTKKRTKKVTSEVNLAPLMDVLTCTVGVMLFVVIFVVLEAKGKSFKLFAPLQKAEAPKKSVRNLFVCKNGKIKFLDIDKANDGLTTDLAVTVDNVPEIVELANKKKIADSYYKFTYDYEETGSYFDGRSMYFTIIVNEVNPLDGEGVNELKSIKSPIAKMIAGLDPKKNWIAFALVDEESIEVFRAAREIANKKGVLNGWDPMKLNFPLTMPLKSSNGSAPTPFIPQ